MKAILFILGCSIIALSMGGIPSEFPSHSDGVKSPIPHFIYWILNTANLPGKYTIPLIGCTLVIASIILPKKTQRGSKKENKSKGE